MLAMHNYRQNADLHFQLYFLLDRNWVDNVIQHLVNSIATVSMRVQNRALGNQMCVKVTLYVYISFL